MKRILGISLLLSILPLLAGAAAIEPTAADQLAHGASSCGEYSTPIRMQIISKVFPKTLEFLVRCYTERIHQEIPDFGANAHLFAICDKTATLLISPFRAQPNNPYVCGELIFWDLKANKLIRHLKGLPFQFTNLLWTPNGNKFITISSDCHVGIWDIDGVHESHNLGRGDLIALNSDGTQLITACLHDKILKVWDVESGQLKYEIANVYTYCSGGTCIAISPDGTKIALCPHTKHINIIDAASGQLLVKISHRYDKALSLDFSQDGMKLFGSLRSELRDGSSAEGKKVWDVSTGEELSHADYGQTQGWVCGTKRIKSKHRPLQRTLSDSIFEDLYIFEGDLVINDATGLLLCSTAEKLVDYISDNWFVAQAQGGGKIYAYDLDKLTAFQHEIASLSDRQLLLINQIRHNAELNKKFKLDCDEAKLAAVIKDYDALRLPIKSVLQDHVIFGAYK